MKRTLTCLIALAAPTALLADAQLDRLEALSEEINDIMMVKMVEEITAETGADPAPLMATIPDMTWDASFRDAGQCMLEGYEAAIGSDGVDTMLDNMEGALPRLRDLDITEMEEEFDYLPEGLSISESIEIQQTCGMMDLALDRMSESGFMEAMMSAATAE